jgi:ribosomal protein L11 methyltransferase
LRIEQVFDEDWVTLSQGKRRPVEAGRFLVYGSHDRARVPHRLLAIEIDAGQAFGTAHHASTRGCLIALDDVLKRSRPRSILDFGTGTGVLAIAAAKALKRLALASDNDPLAVDIARDNARKNGLASLVRVLKATGFAYDKLRSAAPDLVLANLLERALYELAPTLRATSFRADARFCLASPASRRAAPRRVIARTASSSKNASFSTDGQPW